MLKRTRHAVPVDSPIYHAAQAKMQLVAGVNGLDAVFDTEGVDVLFSLADGHQSLPNMIGYPMSAYLLEALGSAGRLKDRAGRCRTDGCDKGWCTVRCDLYRKEIRRTDPSSYNVSQWLFDLPPTLLTSSVPCCFDSQERMGRRVWCKAPTTDGHQRPAAASGTRSRGSHRQSACCTSF